MPQTVKPVEVFFALGILRLVVWYRSPVFYQGEFRLSKTVILDDDREHLLPHYLSK